MVSGDDQGKERVTIILHSADYDRVSHALSLAVANLAVGREAHVLLTYGGLRRFTRGHLEDLGEETPAAMRNILKQGIKSGNVVSLTAQVADAKRLGLRLYACAGPLAVLNIAREELLPEVDEVTGLVAFMQLAGGAVANWYV